MRPNIVPLLLLGGLLLGCPVFPPPPDRPDAGDLILTPIEAPDRTWTYVPMPETYCANGSSTGIAVNIEPGSKELVLFLQGGGACWEGFACLHANEGKGTATHLREEVGEEIVMAEATGPAFFFNRTEEANPFAAASYVYVPYCTGDLHSGDKAMVYDAGFGQTATVHHKGAHNLAAVLERLKVTWPELERITFAGLSAGGLGVTLNWWRVREAFPEARVDALNDSGLPIATSGGEFGTMRSAWNMQLPPGCESCTSGLPALLPHYAQTVPAPARYAMTAYSQDGIIKAYFGYLLNPDGFTARLDEVFASMGERQKAFKLNGEGHVMIGQSPWPSTSGGVTLLDWITDFHQDAEGWDHVGP